MDDERSDEKFKFYVTPHNKRQRFTELWELVQDGWKIEARPPGRTLDQNAKLWPMLHDVSRQITWFERKLSPEEWKDVFTASLQGEHVDMVPTLDHKRFVILGLHTSRLSKHRFSELIELMYSFGAERGVVWSGESQQMFDDAAAYLAKRRAREIDIMPPLDQQPVRKLPLRPRSLPAPTEEVQDARQTAQAQGRDSEP